MIPLFKRTRYYYWLIGGFIRKYAKIMVIVFVIAFFALFFSRTIIDSFTQIFSINKKSVGILKQANNEQIPLEILQMISIPIVTYDTQGRLKPGLAKKWKVNDNGREYTFYFPKDLVWEDGSLFMVTDIDEELIKFPNIKTEIINDYTLKFTLPSSLANFPALLTTPVLKQNLTGINGQYKISRVKYDHGEMERVTLLPMESGLSQLTYKMYNTQDDLKLAYQLGEIDKLVTNDQKTASFFKKWRNSNVEGTTDYNRIITIFVNTRKNPFDNKNLRGAIAFGIDYDQLAKFGERAFSPVLPFSWAYNSEVKEYNYEPEISANVIEQSQLSKKPVTLITSYELEGIAETISKSLNKVGFPLEIRYLNYLPTDYELFMTIWEPPIDPDQYVFWHQTQNQLNYSRLKNVKIDKLLEDGRQEISPTKRKQIYQKWQEVMAEELPAIFLFFPKKYTISRKI